MMGKLLRYLVTGPGLLMLVFSLLAAGCGGQSGQGEADLPPTLVRQTFNEECGFCHDPGSLADVEAVHRTAAKSLDGTISGVTVTDTAGVIEMTVAFELFDLENPLIPIAGVSASDIRFTIAQLRDDNWQSYLNTVETKAAGDPGTMPDNTAADQATYERANTSGGTFTDNGDGTYSYQFSIDFANVTSPTVIYDETLAHRVAMQVSDNETNAFYDFRPNAPASKIANPREIVTNDSCNECHLKLGFHGGDRVAVEYCVTCHNAGSSPDADNLRNADANSGNSLDLKVMVHKIHRGEELPSVQAGGEYAIWGFRNTKHDYSDVVFPQDIRNCTKCHVGDDWKTSPSSEACESCHDDTTFTSFPTPAEIEELHEIPAQIAAGKFQYNILSIADTAPGQFPVITFSVTDPTNGDAPYDILTDPEFTAPAGASRLAVLIGWETAEYENTGSEQPPAQPVSIDALTEATTVDNETFTVNSSVAIPANVTGSGIAAIEGHPAAESVTGSGTYDLRVPVTGVVQTFAITDTTPQDRREVVEIDKCNQCHGVLSLHGANRNNSISLCVICHNPNATDINRRPADPATTGDGKSEETIDFKYMIHAIHGGDANDHGFRENGIVLYGFGGVEHDFSPVRYPGFLNNCETCHSSDTFTLPLADEVLPTTVKTGSDPEDPNDDTEITPVGSVCSSCHDSITDRTHMTEEGARFDFVLFEPEETTDTGGPSGTQPPGHTDRTDCATCH